MAISGVLTAVGAQLTAWGVAFGTEILFGSEHVFTQDVPPRIVAIPRGGPGRPVVHGGVNPRPVWTRSIEVEFHCWGASFDAAESLSGSLLAALHTVASSSVVFGAEEWPELNGELLALGRVVIVRATLLVPVVRPTASTATITTVVQSTNLDVT